MQYRTGKEFEMAIFGAPPTRPPASGTRRAYACFSDAIQDIIRSATTTHPPTTLGECLYHQVRLQLPRLGVRPDGLVFHSSLATKADLFHGTDGFFYLPSLYPHLVTVDAFRLDFTRLSELRAFWADSFAGQFYSDLDFQSDLFMFKTGLWEYKNCGNRLPDPDTPLDSQPDFRRYARRGREENHFVLTPIHVATYEQRRTFATMVAGYFGKVANMV